MDIDTKKTKAKKKDIDVTTFIGPKIGFSHFN